MKLNKKLKTIILTIFTLTMSIFMLWFSFSVLFAGRELFGSEVNIIWASGILTYLGLKGLAESIWIIFVKREKKE